MPKSIVELRSVRSFAEVVVGVNFAVEGEHLLANVDAEVVDVHVLALEEDWQELLGEALSVLFVQLRQVFSVRGGGHFALVGPLEHCFLIY